MSGKDLVTTKVTASSVFFFISNKNILKRRRVSPEYAGSIHQGQKQIKCIKYKSP